MLSSRSLIPLTDIKIVILFYILSLLFYSLYRCFSCFYFFEFHSRVRVIFRLSISLPFLFISLPLFYLFSRDRFESSFSSFSLPSFDFFPRYFIYLVRASLFSFYLRIISISLFVDQVDSVTIPRRPPRRDHSFATMLPVMNGIPSSLSRLYTVYRLRTMGHNYINDNRVTNFTEYRKLVNF